VQLHSTNHKGAIAEAEITAAATRLGIPVLKPLTEHGRYDLVFEVNSRLLRVQCKWGALDQANQLICVRVGGSRHTPNGYVRSTYAAGEIDAVAIYCGALDRSFFVPVDVVAGKGQLSMRLAPPRNHQRASINLAGDYTFEGAIAQLGERLAGSQKGVGSSPTGSTESDASTGPQIGADDFRRLFGWYAERAAAGEELLITRRGEPYVRLGPAQPPLSAAA
jgi:hypothetical protein